MDRGRERERLLFSEITSQKGREEQRVETRVLAPRAPARASHVTDSTG